MESKNLFFFYSSWKEVFDFVYCFRPIIFASKTSNLLLPVGAEGVERAGGREYFNFSYVKGVNQRFTKAVFLQFCKTVRETSR